MKNNRGFSLVEVLASIVILGLLLTVFFQFFVFSQKTTVSNKDKLAAITVAQSGLEQIKKDARTVSDTSPTDPNPYWEITHPVETAGKNSDYGPYNITSDDGKQYTIKVKVGAKLSNGLQMVTVFVYWDNERFKSSVKGYVEL